MATPARLAIKFRLQIWCMTRTSSAYSVIGAIKDNVNFLKANLHYSMSSQSTIILQ